MNIEISDLLFVLLIFQLLLLSLFLFTQQNRQTLTNRLLGAFFLVIALNLIDVFLLRIGVYFTYPSWAGWGACLPLVFGPLLYFFTLSVIHRDFQMNLKKLVHFIPFFIFFLATEVLYISLPYDTKKKLLTNLFNHHIAASFAWTSLLILLQFLLYAAASLLQVAQYKKSAGQHFSNPKSTNVSWLYTTILFFIVVMLITSLNSALAQTAAEKYYLFIFNLVILAVLVFVVKVFLKALQQSQFFGFKTEEARVASKPPLDPDEVDQRRAIVTAAITYMENNKPYLKPDLSLDELSAMLLLKPRALSQAINDIQQQNFFDFVNRYRIEEAVRMLTNPADKKITVLEVLYEVGFNSKSSFNTLFKKYTGVTPTEFRKTHDA
jgi:AraC-like DNA-binding protein